ncbi:general stress protein [Paenibacillus sambharensis]|uniref:General stress protein n=1 Tax=Paenibacillus sambharensis TaxID=1803190 RepID=A0A2W1LVM7_9BACL|nr:NAD(P)H-dependent oxidoreductase [Paenibacillus sambharensis]PZD95557.1 general stress protein [Paenibacillus sambharensis]
MEIHRDVSKNGERVIVLNMMAIVAHPSMETSKINAALSLELQRSGMFMHELYREYPDWSIDVEREQAYLLKYDRIILQFPFYWYSCPPLLKKWFDDVLVPGWAFGPGGDKLAGKAFMVVTTVGGTEKQYRSGGFNKYTMSELLRPIERTLTRCHADFLPPYAVYNTTFASEDEIKQEATRCAAIVRAPVESLIS